MKIYKEQSLRDFEFWGGARDTAKLLTPTELDMVESRLDDLYPEGMDETTINDMFWFDETWIAEILGYPSFEALFDARA